MATLELRPYRPLGAGQHLALAVMGVDVYRRRHLPVAPALAGTAPEAWLQDMLARSIARAAGQSDAAEWSREWLARGHELPDLADLRARPAAKRELWRLLRQQR
jgi:hypothetical protein